MAPEVPLGPQAEYQALDYQKKIKVIGEGVGRNSQPWEHQEISGAPARQDGAGACNMGGLDAPLFAASAT